MNNYFSQIPDIVLDGVTAGYNPEPEEEIGGYQAGVYSVNLSFGANEIQPILDTILAIEEMMQISRIHQVSVAYNQKYEEELTRAKAQNADVSDVTKFNVNVMFDVYWVNKGSN